MNNKRCRFLVAERQKQNNFLWQASPIVYTTDWKKIYQKYMEFNVFGQSFLSVLEYGEQHKEQNGWL